MADNFKFYTELKVRYEETDAMSVVYYGKYFVFFEVARTEYLKNIGYNYTDIEKEGFYFVVAESNCKYFNPARYDDDLKIFTRIEYVKNSSFNFIYNIVKTGKNGTGPDVKIASGSTVLVCVDNADFKPRRLPEYLRKAIRDFEHF
ncbi:MAG: thioesterase family protein [Deltaproteobacteria bacterium]|nr:thioesterase family protein [Deltaproteobacteria bacterium]